MLQMLTTMDRDNEFLLRNRGRIREVFACTAPLPVDVKRSFESKYDAVVRQSYGTSEQLIVTLNDPARGDPENAVGRPLRMVEVTIRDDQNRLVTPNEDGEIWIKTAYDHLGYLHMGRLQESNDSESDWVSTGDIGRTSERDTLLIVGRKSDIIIKGGTNISPTAIETALAGSDLVMGCVAVGIKDELYGEVVGLGVRLRPGTTLRSIRRDLVAELREHLSPIELPSYLLDFRDFPRTPTGKVKRRSVQMIFADQINRAESVR